MLLNILIILIVSALQCSISSPPLCDQPLNTDSLTTVPNSGWWCAKDYPSGQAVPTAVATDSCFCVWFAANSTISVSTGCKNWGGVLTDIRNAQENTLVMNLVSQATAIANPSSTGPLWIGMQRVMAEHSWNKGCDVYPPTYTNFNSTTEKTTSILASYVIETDGTWSPKVNVQTDIANGFVCRMDRNVCGSTTCTDPQVCYSLHQCPTCAIVTTTAAYVPTTPIPADMSNPVPYCDPNAHAGGWWCAADYPLGQSVTSAVSTDSCFCYLSQNASESEAASSCEAIGGYLTDVRNAAENTMIQQLADLASTVAECPTGWALFSENCYKVFDEQINFQPAEDLCVSYGGHLVSIHNQAEFDFLSVQGKNFTINGGNIALWGFWTGATKATTSDYVYTDGTPHDFDLPLASCKSFLPLIQMGLIQNVYYEAVIPDIPCGHPINDDKMNPCCKIKPKIYPFWIGLEETPNTGWNRGCEITPTVPYMNNVAGTLSPSGYTFYQNGSWIQTDPTTSTIGAMCRIDLNPCGVNNCTAQQTCTNMSNCFQCINPTTTTTTTTTTTIPSTTTTTTVPTTTTKLTIT